MVRAANEVPVEQARAHFGIAPGKPLRRRPPREWRGLEEAVEDLLSVHGWLWSHVRPARTKKGGWVTPESGTPGGPDYRAVKARRLLFLEVKDGRGVVSEAQAVWIAALSMVPGVEVEVVTRADVESGRLDALLR